MKRAEIICTLGPASDSPHVLRKLADGGMAVARLNFSHGAPAQHARTMRKVRALRAKIKILQDLEGIRIRIGKFSGNKKERLLEKHHRVVFTNQPSRKPEEIPLDYHGSLKGIRVGDEIFIEDGKIVLETTSGGERSLEARVLIGGVLRQRKGVNIPRFEIPFEGLTSKDRSDLKFGVRHGVDMVAQSFVRHAGDVQALRDELRSLKPSRRIPIIAKIENRQGIERIGEILRQADGIMIARGDMGVSVPIYEIPVIQKRIIRKCNRAGKFVITATQMLESMTRNPRPTRAEVTDVANAVLDGSDYLMLSEETAVGLFPVEATLMMQKVIRFTENSSER